MHVKSGHFDILVLDYTFMQLTYGTFPMALLDPQTNLYICKVTQINLSCPLHVAKIFLLSALRKIFNNVFLQIFVRKTVVIKFISAV